ncbi:MAG: DNA alkylation repair protein, partial [Phycisphaerae bacterium]|nr:DNA alkylation repair protein [Phycisphaerae bacterium]
MALSTKARKLAAEVGRPGTKMGDLKSRGKEIGKDHVLALELWSTGGLHARLLATLVFDKRLLTQGVIDQLAADLRTHGEAERNQISEWLLANQLMKDKMLTALVETWRGSKSPTLRRLFWYHQARLRWTGQDPPGNSEALLDVLEKDMARAEPEVQWAMNFCACQIALHEGDLRARCLALGKKLGLYKDEKVPRNCTPSYLPEFVRIEL